MESDMALDRVLHGGQKPRSLEDALYDRYCRSQRERGRTPMTFEEWYLAHRKESSHDWI